MRRLVLFFEFRTGLVRADQFGLLERNLALFTRLVETGYCDKINFFTYTPADRAFLSQCQVSGRLPDYIELLLPPDTLTGRLGSIVYSLIGPFIHRQVFKDAIVQHTYQVSGAWTGLIARFFLGTPLLFRCGYPLSVRFNQEDKSFNYWLARLVEWALVRYSDHVAVTSQTMREYYGGMGDIDDVSIVANYVDLSSFSQIPDYDRRRPILFVGRLVEVKNIENLIIACARLEHPLHLYGDGPLKSELQELAKTTGADVTFKGVVPNAELARLHRNYAIYVTCSIREGMPKSVIEAMASGLIIVGTRTDGVLELIEDGVTGYLIDGLDADAIEATLRSVLNNLDSAVGKAACEHVREHYSLDSATSMTADILSSIERR